MVEWYKADSSFERVVVMAGKRKRNAKARQIQLHRLLEEASEAISLERLYSGTGVIWDTNRAGFLCEVYPDLVTPPNTVLLAVSLVLGKPFFFSS